MPIPQVDTFDAKRANVSMFHQVPLRVGMRLFRACCIPKVGPVYTRLRQQTMQTFRKSRRSPSAHICRLDTVAVLWLCIYREACIIVDIHLGCRGILHEHPSGIQISTCNPRPNWNHVHLGGESPSVVFTGATDVHLERPSGTFIWDGDIHLRHPSGSTAFIWNSIWI